MLIKLIQEKRTETFIIEEGSGRTISILNEICRIRLKDGRVLLEVSDQLKTEEAGKIGLTILQHKKSGFKAVLIRFENDQGWDRFCRYTTRKEIITAGSSETDDIRFSVDHETDFIITVSKHTGIFL